MLTLLKALLGPVIVPGLVRLAEQVFGPKTGEMKRGFVFKALRLLSDALSGGGQLPGLADDKDLLNLLEDILAREKQQGSLGERKGGTLELDGRTWRVVLMEEVKR